MHCKGVATCVRVDDRVRMICTRVCAAVDGVCVDLAESPGPKLLERRHAESMSLNSSYSISPEPSASTSLNAASRSPL